MCACTGMQLVRKRIPVTRLDFGDLIVGQFGKFVFPTTFRQNTRVLAQRAKQQVDGTVRHVDDLRHATTEGVVSLQISGFRRQIDIDRPCHAFIEEFGVRRGVEKTIEIGRLVKDPHNPFVCRLPFDERQQAGRIAFKSAPVIVNSIQDSGADWEHHARRIKAAFRQNMMNQISVQPAVAVRERVDIDKPEGEDCGGKDRVQIRRCLAIERDEPLDQGRQVLVPCADMVRQGRAGVAVPVAHKAPLVAQAQQHKAIVADDDALQAQQFVEVDRLAPRFANGSTPALNAILRRMLASISKLERESFSSRKAAVRASTSAGKSATTSRARAGRLRLVNSRKVSVRKIIGQKDGVPGKLFLTR